MKKQNIILLSSIAIFSAGLLLALFFYKRSPNPATQIREANTIIRECINYNGENFASSTLKEAKKYYDLAVNAWELENQRWFFFRNYDSARNCAIKASEIAKKAIQESRQNEKRMNHELEIKISQLNANIALYDSILSRIPLNRKERDSLNNGKIKFKEGVRMFENNNLPVASQKIKDAFLLLNPLFADLEDRLVNYFSNYEIWQRDIEATIKYSREKKTKTLIVDKFSRKCFLYDKGKLIKEYQVELGKNSLNDKIRQGDFATPEGIYEVTKKKTGIHTRYHKALLINYPNSQDKLEFQERMKSGIIKSDEKIGGSIEIHGHGGKGGDWTEGCIALENEDMDAIYNFAMVGTKVAIVGSSKGLEDYLPEPLK